MKIVECSHCGWHHFTVTREEAMDEIARFNKYYDSLSEESKKHYRGHSSIESYEKCFKCGASYKDMQEPTKNIGDGHTLQSIIDKDAF